MMNTKPVLISRSSPSSQQPQTGAEKTTRFDPLTPTIFHEEWWLDAATGGNFGVAESISAGRIVGRLPYHVTKRLGMRMMRMPQLTYFLGPAIHEGEGSPNTRFLKRLEITRDLIRKLPRTSWQYVKCHGGVSDVIAFQELGFRTYVQFTHEVAPQSMEELWQQMRNKTRNVIRRAKERFTVTEVTDPVEFVVQFERNLASKGLRNEIDRVHLRNVVSASLERKRGRILAARDKRNQIAAANFCVWDAASSFYVLSTRSGSSGNGAGSLLLWEAIKESVRQGLVFDFAGLGTRGSILLYSGFGGVISARYVALRTRALARAVYELRAIFAPENYFY